MLKKGLSIVIPVYGSEQTLRPLCEQIIAVLLEKRPLLSYEIILVNDASPDRVAEDIQGLCARHAQVRQITLIRNYGQHNALLAGVREARYDQTITMDDDGQHPAAAIPVLLDSMNGHWDLVYAAPLTEKHGALRDFASRSVKCLLNKTLRIGGSVELSSFRIFRTHIRMAFQDYNSSSVFLDALLAWGARTTCMIRVEHQARTSGRSGYTLGRLIKHTLNMITSFSVGPLHFAGVVGLLTILIGIALFAVSITRFIIVGREMPGFMFLIAAITLFSGVQLFSLGVLGEYVAQIHARSMNRPAYVIFDRGADAPDGQARESDLG